MDISVPVHVHEKYIRIEYVNVNGYVYGFKRLCLAYSANLQDKLLNIIPHHRKRRSRKRLNLTFKVASACK
jgi:hypothetical protein